jgi:hypothetical protein
MNIRLDKVEIEMLKVLIQKDKRYRGGLEGKVRVDIRSDYHNSRKISR